MPNLNPAQAQIAKETNPEKKQGLLADALKGADIFIGVSGPNCVTKEMVMEMAKDPIIFPLANPVPEIQPKDALEAGAFIVGTGSSEFPNQVNNALVFPGLFRGAIDARAKQINTEMMMAASYAIASCISDEELTKDHILPFAYDQRAHDAVARCVKEAAIKSGICK